ncbi:hypothetical protein BGX12_1426 [Fibrobacter sp. UWR4]|nr:hypothetical protein BGX12_1426 [Fibrobacter sp. UWR4]PZW63700.1 hypothetical protein C8E88_10426 [Fibrobacter sp. UWR1]
MAEESIMNLYWILRLRAAHFAQDDVLRAKKMAKAKCLCLKITRTENRNRTTSPADFLDSLGGRCSTLECVLEIL